MDDVQLSPLRQGGSFKSTLSGRSTPRGSPTYRRVHSVRTQRREARGSGGVVQWFRSSRLVYWLLLITLWTYLGFYVQSRWAHGDDDSKEKFLAFGGNLRADVSVLEQNKQQDSVSDEGLHVVENNINKSLVAGSKRIDVILEKKEDVAKKEDGASRRSLSSRKKTRKSGRSSRNKIRGKQMARKEVEIKDSVEQDPELPKTNATDGKLFGPFGSLEDRVLEWSPQKRTGTCDRKSDFSRLVWSRRFILVFHELSMTGAPISMMELASELLSCGATVYAVVLSRKGGLMQELTRRRIKVIEDKADLSFKTAMKADLVIPGSAVCASWIDQYIEHFPAGGSQIAWWIMENRREYFDRARPVLERVKMLIFLSESQSKQWLTWCEEEHIKLRSQPVIVPLSVNDDLAFVAGIPCSLNTPTVTPEKMMEKRHLLRESVRTELGLKDTDMLAMSLSSINPGKGQLLLLESAALVLEKAQEQEAPRNQSKIKNLKATKKSKINLAARHHLRGSSRKLNGGSVSPINPSIPVERMNSTGFDGSAARRKLSGNTTQKQDLQVLIGSVGSKSNKIPYVKEILSFLSSNGNLSKSVLWTPATTRVASLYSAADVLIINSQGMGETFGRVTIEAMAYGLPVLGTDAGGTKEIVEHNVTGLLHPIGRPGNKALSENLVYFLRNPSTRLRMGNRGREKAERMYMKRHMYKRFVDVLTRCMRP